MIEFPELPGWAFEVEEVSFGVFRVSGHDVDGRSIVRTGTDPDGLLEVTRLEARDIAPAPQPKL